MGKSLGGFQIYVEIHVGDGSKGGGRIIDDLGVYQAAAEYGRTVHCYSITIRPV